MKEIKYDEIVYAIQDNLLNIEKIETKIKKRQVNKEVTTWYGNNTEAIQASRMCYNVGKEFKTHKHILRPRLNNYTQECLIVIQGQIKVDIYNLDKVLIGEIEGNPGDIVILYKGYHKLLVTENNSIFYEVKNGCFTTVQEDKTFL